MMAYGRSTRPEVGSGECPRYIALDNRGSGQYCKRPVEEGTTQCKRHNTIDRKRVEKEKAWQEKWDEDRKRYALATELADQLKALGVECSPGHPGGVHFGSDAAQKLIDRLRGEQ